MNEEEKDVFIHELKCVKCGHKWIPRKAEVPKACPRCKNFNWMGGKSLWKLENDARPKAKKSLKTKTRSKK